MHTLHFHPFGIPNSGSELSVISSTLAACKIVHSTQHCSPKNHHILACAVHSCIQWTTAVFERDSVYTVCALDRAISIHLQIPNILLHDHDGQRCGRRR